MLQSTQLVGNASTVCTYLTELVSNACTGTVCTYLTQLVSNAGESH